MCKIVHLFHSPSDNVHNFRCPIFCFFSACNVYVLQENFTIHQMQSFFAKQNVTLAISTGYVVSSSTCTAGFALAECYCMHTSSARMDKNRCTMHSNNRLLKRIVLHCYASENIFFACSNGYRWSYAQIDHAYTSLS